ncbi:cupredoxin domain-containing protein [Mesoterricola silvestris]|uniref:Plastocyanin n=1 Tax=Mesoterricola silvestris TaxID=2927979 RepID=A0AA48GX32_9BACT|nr:hypothetical protein [Mesoterricola silvestris]BDU71938.1 hypothetical protein METEAL_11120 [Mesoterricola silvestris]
MVRCPLPFLVALALGVPAAAGSLAGPVQVLDKGHPRPNLKDCVAILEPLTAPAAVPGPGKPVTIRTLGKAFHPRVTLVTPGTEVTFPNLDHILHNVFSVTPGNRFDTGHYRPGEAPRVKVANPGLVKLYCNIHHQMNAYLWVVDTPFAQLLEGRAGVQFDGVPPGRYRLRLWHPETGERQWEVAVGPGITRGGWQLEVSLPSVEPHKNKFGRDYPPPEDERSY